MNTLEDVMTPHGVEIPEHLEAQAEIPLVTKSAQRQGDVYVLPMKRASRVDGAVPVPPEGVPVVRGEAGGNTHLLVAVGPATWLGKTVAGDPAIMGILTVPKGSEAYLIHPEHGGTGMGPGQYTIRRQREQREMIELVRD